jgi:uncharacterized membrane protein
MEWFYVINNQQQGPVGEEALRSMHASGAINNDTLVWRQGMDQWAAYGAVMGAAAAPGTTGGKLSLSRDPNQQTSTFSQEAYATTSVPVDNRPRGTGGNASNAELRAQARGALSGNWTPGVLGLFLFWVFTTVAGLVPFIGGVVQFVVSGPLSIGLDKLFLTINRQAEAKVDILFNGFRQFLQGLGIYFFTTLFIGLAFFAAAVPGAIMAYLGYQQFPENPEGNPLFIGGIVLAVGAGVIVGIFMYLRYALVYFIAADEPDCGVFEPIRTSVSLMKGRKGKLFGLYLSFIGWHFLGSLALGIGLLWSVTYQSAAIAAFYDDLKDSAS